MKNICIIPARGGSKRIPRKNIIDFCGKPLLAYSVENALNSKIFDEIFVSSDDDEILQTGIKFGAKALLRDENLSDDYTTSSQVIKENIKKLIESGENLDSVCCLYATAPLINADILKKAFERFKENKSKFLFAATEFDYPIQRAFKLDENFQVSMFDERYYNSRSQDLTKAYHDSGAFYFGKASEWLSENIMFRPHSSVFLLPKKLVCDIDTMQDLEFAKLLYKANYENIN
ncbi:MULTISPECIES: pseudaminic acid cytidylyltransferase [unclassified Campylobacter]|uniref:pseudaminic acid cytidylyltransferase n=1 Tax=unclassified Campylobacter TaxID=2593542 RepID=UPI0012381E53|nr:MULTISPECIES: pseudaminic acid cytidylyltransferase [unclassified Campylobacter]KAA6227507.1 pseudaminic acid cytidylyltransferase [Campylobacter sp. LR196d]KAA6228141.1 pseudaminic acid cytidylyltransferase [Campylobacter sp. LR185c]KAA6228533.1 pseudaminic acid cytidylyltransferase [Campylobacter sp. LR286c]KAA6230924.1 pseudaminic acid cytidylyltransferase [Campylobacter sp. LR291e]KAA6233558.1 pseudaminic acid cytidylyltransferase [Campylobacter sp. LR264d]